MRRERRASATGQSKASVPPVWLMGLSNASLGLYGGIAFFVVPQLLSARHVPPGTIASISAAAYSPNFWAVIFGPMLDVRFSRRWYATFFATLESISILIAVTNISQLTVVGVVLVAGTAVSMLSSTALGGWLSTVTEPDEKNTLSAWVNIAVIGGFGLTSYVGGELARHLSLRLASGLLAAIVLLPATIFLFIPSHSPDQRLASESFREFNHEILALLRRREVLVSLLLFISPCASFALTNMLGGLGNDFHTSPRLVSMAGGFGAILAGVGGCLLFPRIAKGVPLRLLYFATGILGGFFTLSLLLLPRTPVVFLFAMMGEFLFQAVSFATQGGIVFETIGQGNPLAATTFTFLLAATNVPITYMLLIDGRAYARGGIASSLIADASTSIAACVLIALLLAKFRGDENMKESLNVSSDLADRSS